MDAIGSYAQGVCGELRIALNAGTPPFLSITADPSDPVTQPFSVNYDYTQANEVDIATHTVHYTVSSVRYSGMVVDHTGTFSFQIVCPDNVGTSTITTATIDYTYDLASGLTDSITAPVIAFTPSSCFTITTYVLTDNVSNLIVDYVTVSSTTIGINSQDWTLKSAPQIVKIETELNNG